MRQFVESLGMMVSTKRSPGGAVNAPGLVTTYVEGERRMILVYLSSSLQIHSSPSAVLS